MADVARRAQLDRATARRLCLSLVESGYLRKDGNFLSLTPRILTIAGGYLATNQIGRVVQPILNRFAAELGGEISLAIRDGDRAIYVAQSALPDARVSIGFTVGSTIPLFPTSVGRMLLGLCTAEEVSAVLVTADLQPHTPKTELDPDELAKKIAAAGRQGYALVQDEFELGASGLAVPAGALGADAAVVGTTAATSKLNDSANQGRTLAILREAAQALSGRPVYA